MQKPAFCQTTEIWGVAGEWQELQYYNAGLVQPQPKPKTDWQKLTQTCLANTSFNLAKIFKVQIQLPVV
jgi:hypothetical protein